MSNAKKQQHEVLKMRLLIFTLAATRRGSRGGALGRAPTLGRKDPRPRLKGRKKGHWCLLNGCSIPFRHNMAINNLEKLQICVCVCQKSLNPIPYKVIIPLAPPLAESWDPRLATVAHAQVT